jgi:hypothetical protein
VVYLRRGIEREVFDGCDRKWREMINILVREGR